MEDVVDKVGGGRSLHNDLKNEVVINWNHEK